MNSAATAAAVVLAGVFAWAGVAKLARPAATAAVLRAFGLPGASVLARGVPTVELALAGLLLGRPRAGGLAALALLALFSGLLATRLARGGAGEVACGCFGGTRSTGGATVELARNGLLSGLAVAALGAPTPVAPQLPAVVALGAALASGAVLLALVDLRTTTGSVWGSASRGPSDPPRLPTGGRP